MSALPYAIPIPTDFRRPLAAAWLLFGVAALLVSGLFVLLILASRVPGLSLLFPGEDFFRIQKTVTVGIGIQRVSTIDRDFTKIIEAIGISIRFQRVSLIGVGFFTIFQPFTVGIAKFRVETTSFFTTVIATVIVRVGEGALVKLSGFDNSITIAEILFFPCVVKAIKVAVVAAARVEPAVTLVPPEPIASEAVTEEQSKESMVQLLTDDPNIVIYWLIDPNGGY